MGTREYERKLEFDPLVFANPSGNNHHQSFRRGKYFADKEDDKASAVVYLLQSEEKVKAYCDRIQNLDTEYFMKPKSIARVGNSRWRVCFEDRGYVRLSQFIIDNNHLLFDMVNEKGVTAHKMSSLLLKVIMKTWLGSQSLHRDDLVHGNLTLDTTFVLCKGELVTPKLFGFKVFGTQEIDLRKEKCEDRRSIANMITTIFTLMKKTMSQVTKDFVEVLCNTKDDPMDHPILFTFGSKEHLVRQLHANELYDEYDELSLRWPTLPSGYVATTKYDRKNLSGFIDYLRAQIEHDRENSKVLIKGLEEKWPRMWVELVQLRNVENVSISTQRSERA